MSAVTVADVLDIDAPERGRGGYRRDQYGRPLVIQPDGTFRPYVESSKATKLLTDTTALEFWQRAKSIRGVIHDDTLVERVRSLGDPWDDMDKAGRAELRAVLDAADIIAETHRARDEGTATHTALEQALRGEAYDPRFEATISAVLRALADAGLTPDPDYVEVAIVNDELEMAGTMDLLVAQGQMHYATDLKTGKTVEHSHIEHPGQLVAYAGGVLYDPAAEVRLPTPTISQEIGYIIHAPAGTGECTIYRADLVNGRRACLLANAVREMRRESKDWLTPVATSDPALLDALSASLAVIEGGPVVPLERIETEAAALRERFRSAHAQGARLTWPDGVPTFPQGGPSTWAQLLAVEEHVMAAERQVQAPFADKLPADPTVRPNLRLVGVGPIAEGGVLASPDAPRPALDVLDRLKAMHQALPTDLQQAAYGAAMAAGVSSDQRTWTEDHMPTLERILQAATDEHGKRKAHLTSVLQDLEDEMVGVLVCAAISVDDLPAEGHAIDLAETMTGDSAERLEALVDALGTAVGITLDAPEQMRLVCLDLAEEHVLDAYGRSKADALAAAKELAALHGRPKPRSVAQACSDPILVALLIAGD